MAGMAITEPLTRSAMKPIERDIEIMTGKGTAKETETVTTETTATGKGMKGMIMTETGIMATGTKASTTGGIETKT